MNIFSWQLAEALAVAHMKSLGFSDTRATREGSDNGLDAVSGNAAAQVKAWSSPVGAPELQKLKGAAHTYNVAIFYSLSGYTAQAREFAESAEIALFSFTTENLVTPENDYAEALAGSSGDEEDRKRAILATNDLVAAGNEIGDLFNAAAEWVAASPWKRIVPQARINTGTTLILGLQLELVTGPLSAAVSSADPGKTAEAAQSGKQVLEGWVARLGESIDLDFSDLAVSTCIEVLRKTLRGDTSRLRVSQMRDDIATRFVSVDDAWSFFLPINAVIVRFQKFQKGMNEETNKIQEDFSLDVDSDPRTSAHRKELRQRFQEFQEWGDTALHKGVGSAATGERILLDTVSCHARIASVFALDANALLDFTDSQPASWLSDTDEDDDEDDFDW